MAEGETRERPIFEDATENPQTMFDQAGAMLDHIAHINRYKPSQGPLRISVLTVLGSGWPEVWEQAIMQSAEQKNVKVELDIQAFDNNQAQIREFGKRGDTPVHYINLGTEEGDDALIDVLESQKPNIVFLSNIPDKIEHRDIQSLAEKMFEHSRYLPEVLMVSCGANREASSFGQFVDEMQGSYSFRPKQGIDSSKVVINGRRMEVPRQDIGYLK